MQTIVFIAIGIILVTFICMYGSWKIVVVFSGWLVFTSLLLTILYQIKIKIIIMIIIIKVLYQSDKVVFIRIQMITLRAIKNPNRG